MPNELFPVALLPELDSMLPETFSTLRTPKDAATISTISKWRFPKVRAAKLSFIATLTQLTTYRTFWSTVRGGGIPFDFLVPWGEYVGDLYAGTGDGVEDVFIAPLVLGDGLPPSVYVDGALQTAGADYATAATGDNDRVVITFTGGSIPADGAVVTVYSNNNQRILIVVGKDLHKPQEIGTELFRITVVLDEV